MKKLIKILISAVLSIVILSVGIGCDNKNEKSDVKVNGLYDVALTDGMLLSKQTASEKFLKSLDSDKLMYFFYTTARLPVRNNATPYLGWEVSNAGSSVAGHTLGHYLSAISMMYASTGDEWYKNKAEDIVNELEKCQKYNGFLFSRDESDFDAVERGENSSGVIYYTVHKILSGLVDAYTYFGNEKALELASEFMDWIYFRISHLNENQVQAMLLVEYGGMNEIAYIIYEITQKPEHLKVAETFNEKIYLDAWAENNDNLSGKHANTQIPKAVGFAKGYILTGEKKLFDAAKNFWDMVVYHRTFAIGGNAENEHFGEKDVTSNQFYYNPDETCNIYNMCKLSSYLFMITGDVKYADYMERALLNGLAGSIDEDGLKTYYQWLSTDSIKLFHTHDASFWCCTGTGMESFAKLSLYLAYKTDGGYTINIFQNATYKYDDVKFSIVNEDEKNTITFETGGKIELSLRVPYYAKSVSLKINGEKQSVIIKNGYITLKREFKKGDVIEYVTPYKVYTESAYDDKDVIAFKYGPYVLAAVGARYEKKNYVAGYTNGGWLSNLGTALEKIDNGYILHTDDFDIPMKRYCDIVNEQYTVYFKRVNTLPAEARVEDIAMRSAVTSDLGYSENYDSNLSNNFWYMPDGSNNYLEAVNDGYIGENSLGKSEFSNDLFTYNVPYTQIPAGEHWIAYDFGSVKTVKSISVYFYDNIATVVAPEYYVEYKNGDSWLKVSNMSEATTMRNQYNTVTFDPVKCDGLRLMMKGTKSYGIIEWKVN